jgi:hypothetical protein
MPRFRAIVLLSVACLLMCHAAEAQEPPPRIGPFVVDLHGAIPTFGDDVQLAESRGLTQAELPGIGLGMSGGAHLYFAKVGPITLGAGVTALIGRSQSGATTPADQSAPLRAVTETFKTISPQFSLNFGDGNGWSYLSVGIGQSIWSIVPDGSDPLPVDEERFRTISYGGGARWFAKKHLAFSLDVRFYEIKAGTPQLGFPASPHTVLLVIGAGISLK